jgi:hypothetical protein
MVDQDEQDGPISDQQDREASDIGFLRSAGHGLIAAAIFVVLTSTLLGLHQTFSHDRWRGDAIGWAIAYIVMDSIMLLIVVTVISLVVQIAKQRSKPPK